MPLFLKILALMFTPKPPPFGVRITHISEASYDGLMDLTDGRGHWRFPITQTWVGDGVNYAKADEVNRN
jgi:hypothetical protein